jgi:hypothetical protein
MKRWNMHAIRNANHQAGMHWFTPGTMQFFNSRIETEAVNGPNGVYFVSSEQFDHKAPRLFTVRKFDPETGGIDTIGEFQAWASIDLALNEAKRLARGE